MDKIVLTDTKGETVAITEENSKIPQSRKHETDYRERMLNEYTALVIRKNRLIKYLLDLPENTESSPMTDAMWEQVSAMDDYEIALRKRLLLVMGVEIENQSPPDLSSK